MTVEEGVQIMNLDELPPSLRGNVIGYIDVPPGTDIKVIQENIMKSIFRPAPGDALDVRQGNKRKRFNVMHKVIKTKLIYPVLRLIKNRMDSIMVKNLDDIPDEWFNVYI